MKYVLVKSRHSHPSINDLPAIFETVTNEQIFDFDLHKKIIHSKLKTNNLILYVTGLTPLLISVLNYCRLFNINVILYHYDTASNHYVVQTVV
jgi:hypothetical protein